MKQLYGPEDIVLMRRLTMSNKVETIENEPEKIRHKLTCFAALTIPLAIISHFIIPPKMFTKIAFTLSSEVNILNASTTYTTEIKNFKNINTNIKEREILKSCYPTENNKSYSW